MVAASDNIPGEVGRLPLIRLFLVIIGVIICAVGISAASKLFRETLDSPRWMIATLAGIALVAGCGAIVLAVRLRR